MSDRDYLTPRQNRHQALTDAIAILQEEADRLMIAMLRSGEAKRSPEGNIDIMITRPPF